MSEIEFWLLLLAVLVTLCWVTTAVRSREWEAYVWTAVSAVACLAIVARILLP